jgi:hypothetical protein
MKAPLTCLSVFVSNDLKNMNLRLEHTHFFLNHGDAGHYHYDTTLEEIKYKAFLVPAEHLFRIESFSIFTK